MSGPEQTDGCAEAFVVDDLWVAHVSPGSQGLLRTLYSDERSTCCLGVTIIDFFSLDMTIENELRHLEMFLVDEFEKVTQTWRRQTSRFISYVMDHTGPQSTRSVRACAVCGEHSAASVPPHYGGHCVHQDRRGAASWHPQGSRGDVSGRAAPSAWPFPPQLPPQHGQEHSSRRWRVTKFYEWSLILMTLYFFCII